MDSPAENAEESVLPQQRRFPKSLVVVSLVIVNSALFFGAYLLSVFVLLECLDETVIIPGWIPMLIVVIDILWVILLRFCPISNRAKVFSKFAVPAVSAGVVLAILCVWGLPV